MTFKDFELLVQKLISKRLESEFGKKIPVLLRQKFTSLSGNTYEIDVSYNLEILGVEYLTLIECKLWNSHVTREKIGYFKAIIDDLKAHKGIVVTTKGFQSGAITFAKSQKIALIKIVNEDSFEIGSHFDGGIATIENILSRVDDFDSSQNHDSVGLFEPNIDIYDFIRIFYGQELASFLLNEFTPEILDQINPELPPLVKDQLINFPEEFYDEYIRFATGGLKYQISNELHLRRISSVIQYLKLGQKNY